MKHYTRPLLVMTVISLVHIAASAQSAELMDQGWALLRERLKNLVSPNAPESDIQLLPIAKALPHTDAALFRAQWIELADSIPAKKLIWTASKDRFSDNYRQLVESVVVPNQASISASAREKASSTYAEAKDNETKLRETLLAEFASFKRQHPEQAQIPWNIWLQNDSSQAQAYELSRASTLAAKASINELDNAESRIVRSYKEQMLDYKLDPSRDRLGDELRYPYNSEEARKQVANLIDPIAKTPAVNWKFENSSVAAEKTDVTREFETTTTMPRFLHYESKTNSPTEVSIAISANKLDLSAIALVRIAPGSWFSGGLMTMVNADRSRFLPPSKVNLIRDDGPLSRRPIGVVVVVNPKITMSLAQSAYSHTLTTLKRGVRLYVGPFLFDTASDQVFIEASEQTHEITISEARRKAYAVAVVTTGIKAQR